MSQLEELIAFRAGVREALGIRSNGMPDDAAVLAQIRAVVPPSITCPRCQMTSHNPNDALTGYCGNCHDFTSSPVPGTRGAQLLALNGGESSVAAGSMVLQERQRQLEAEGYTQDHDDQHLRGELAWAAACYAAPDRVFRMKTYSASPTEVLFVEPWPGNPVPWRRPTATRVTLLVRAGALILAEIARLLRKDGV